MSKVSLKISLIVIAVTIVAIAIGYYMSNSDKTFDNYDLGEDYYEDGIDYSMFGDDGNIADSEWYSKPDTGLADRAYVTDEEWDAMLEQYEDNVVSNIIIE